MKMIKAALVLINWFRLYTYS